MCHLRLQIPRIRAGSVTRYRTGIAVTPENDDLSDVRLTRATAEPGTERYVVVFDRILLQRRSGVSGRPANARPF